MDKEIYTVWEQRKEKKSKIWTTTLLTNTEIDRLFTPLKKGEINKENTITTLTNIVKHTHKILKKERFENSFIDKNFSKQTTRELLTTGKTFYMNPCLDFVLVTIEWLKKSGFENIQFIMEELECPQNIYKVHFGIEVTIKNNPYYIDYIGKNDVHIGKWKFASNFEHKGETVVNTTKTDAKNISLDDTLYSLVEKKVIHPKNFKINELLETFKTRLKKHNTIENRNRGFVEKVKNIHEPEIFIENIE